MTFRKRTRMSAKLAAARASKARRRMEGEAPDYPPDLPDLRREIIIRDHDFGLVEHRIELHRTNRRDCYRVVADGKEWGPRMGWSRVLESIRKSFLRIGNE